MNTADSKITDLSRKKDRPWLSLEFFPPKTDAGMEKLGYNAQLLTAANPDFVTVTWGAGGSTQQRTLDVCRMLRETGFAPVMPHLTCVGVGRAELEHIVDGMYEEGYRNIMTLRGDPPKGESNFVPHPDGLHYAGELVELIKSRHADMCCGVAGYPEVHPEAESFERDLVHLKGKIDAGGDFVTTQLFYDNAKYFSYFDKCREQGIKTLILPGVLPVVSLKQVERLSVMCGSVVPEQLMADLNAANGDIAEEEQIGLDFTVRQIDELLAAGAPGVHLYILNDSKAALSRELMACFRRIRGH